MVDLAVDQNDGLYACIPDAIAGMRFWELFQLGSDIGRCVKKHPFFAVRTNGDRRLGSLLALDGSISDSSAIVTVAVPLRETASCTCAQHTNLHGIATPEIKTGPDISVGPRLLQAVD